MIKLRKLKEPVILSVNKQKWTDDLMSYINGRQKVPDSVKNKYNHIDIKTVLEEETHSKCMYCESYIPAVAPGHIEHYRPKDKYPDRIFEWNNLGLACPWCNIKKHYNFDENCAFINPYFEDPNDHFISLGTMVCHKPNNRRAELTELQLELNRPELMECRKERIDAIRPLIDKYKATVNPTLKDILRKNIEREMLEDKPYAMCVRAIVKLMINL
jgi:uncharacterized protein (TIGR02646 family)